MGLKELGRIFSTTVIAFKCISDPHLWTGSMVIILKQCSCSGSAHARLPYLGLVRCRNQSWVWLLMHNPSPYRNGDNTHPSWWLWSWAWSLLIVEFPILFRLLWYMRIASLCTYRRRGRRFAIYINRVVRRILSLPKNNLSCDSNKSTAAQILFDDNVCHRSFLKCPLL